MRSWKPWSKNGNQEQEEPQSLEHFFFFFSCNTPSQAVVGLCLLSISWCCWLSSLRIRIPNLNPVCSFPHLKPFSSQTLKWAASMALLYTNTEEMMLFFSILDPPISGGCSTTVWGLLLFGILLGHSFFFSKRRFSFLSRSLQPRCPLYPCEPVSLLLMCNILL